MDMRSMGDGVLENRGGGIRQGVPVFERDRARYQNYSCERPFAMMVVNSRGQVVLCCDDLYGDVVMGDIRSHRLEEIWNNERFAFYRSTLKREGRCSLPLCRECSYSGKGFRPFFPYPGEKTGPQLWERLRLGLELTRGCFSRT